MIYYRLDKVIVFVSIILFLIGLLCLYSASYTKGTLSSRELVFKQILWFLLGCVPFMVVVLVEYQRIVDLGFLLYGFAILLLILVLLLGRERLGAQRWLTISGFSFQPSEFTKIVYIIAMSSYLGRIRIRIQEFRYVAGSLIISAVPFIFILIQPDLGTAVILLPVLFAMLFVAGAKVRHLVYLALSGFLLMPLFWHLLKEYQKKRLLVFLNPNIDPLGAGYTIIQSKIAIGSGGLWGKGWLSGTQNLLNFLPERHTDFIFSVVGEEWGFIGSMVLLFLYFILIKRGIRIAEDTTEIYGKLISTGIVTMLAFQIIVNISMTVGLMPVVGLPLPLLSYGGSSMWTTMVGIALLLNIKMRKTRF